MPSNVYALASAQQSASGTKRQVAAIAGYEDVRLVGELGRARTAAYRARRKSQPTAGEDDVEEGAAGPEGKRRRGKHIERAMDFLADPLAHEAELPSDDLLKHIYRRTTELYSQPHSGGLGKKLLDQDAWEAGARRQRQPHRPRSPGPSDDSGLTDEGEDELDSAAEDGDDSDGGSVQTMGSRRSSRSARSLRRKGSRASVASAQGRAGDAADGGGPSRKARGGPHGQRKNMYKALTGDTLVALGVLMEEFIKHTVHEAGYPDSTGGALYLDAVSDDEAPAAGLSDRARGVKFARASADDSSAAGSPSEGEDTGSSSSSSTSDEDEGSDSAGATSSGTDSSSVARRKPRPKGGSGVDVKEEQRRKRRLFRGEEDRFQELLESGAGQGDDDESESDGDGD